MVDIVYVICVKAGRLVNRGNALSSHRSDARSYSAKTVGAYSAAVLLVRKLSGQIVQSGAYSAKTLGAYSAEWGI